MTFKIKTLNNISSVGLRRFPQDRYDVGPDVEEPDAILVRSHDMHKMEIPRSVLAVGRAGAGVNNIPVKELSGRGVVVFNAPGANANAVKELVLSGMLIAARGVVPAWQYVKGLDGEGDALRKAVESGKKQFVGFELPGRTLGVVGLGAIGVQVANAALSLGMHVRGYDPQITVERAWQLSSGVQQAASLDDLFNGADFISVHVPLTDSTRALVNRQRLRLLRENGVILNFARDGIVDEDAVIESLDENHLRAYVTDFPTPRLIAHPKAICLPHLGASTLEAEDNCAVMVVDDVTEFLENGNVRHSVNFPEAVLTRTRPHRLTVANQNVPNMVGQISAHLAGEAINIADLLNVSRGGLAYTIIDLDGPVSGETLGRIRGVDGILSARVLPVS
jgi:D-3-phosphoglycerate dehydrogenase / 2-oxoglutarate reductase